ncbi:MAG: phosphoglycerate mutase family protein [Bacteroidota bacterium]
MKIVCIIYVLISGIFASGQIDGILEYYQELELKHKNNPGAISFIKENQGLIANYDSLYQIILIRHGEPKLDKSGWRSRKGAMSFIQAYDSAGVYAPSFLPVRLEESEVNAIYTSSLNRSISTAEQLYPQFFEKKEKRLFREFERKIVKFYNLKLPLDLWLKASRVFWYAGLNDKGIESVSKAKRRALKGAEFLEDNAIQEGKSLLVSHGFLNRFIVKNLE